jgi:hypothetical protein
MMEKENYIVVVEHYDKQLSKAVNEKIAEGYQPHGNLVVAFNSDGVIKNYVQVMLLKTEA